MKIYRENCSQLSGTDISKYKYDYHLSIKTDLQCRYFNDRSQIISRDSLQFKTMTLQVKRSSVKPTIPTMFRHLNPLILCILNFDQISTYTCKHLTEKYWRNGKMGLGVSGSGEEVATSVGGYDVENTALEKVYFFAVLSIYIWNHVF